jgi:hypothetical protein
MDDLGMVALLLLLGVGFAFYVGGPSICTYNGLTDCDEYAVPGFVTILDTFGKGDFSTLFNNNIYLPILAILGLGGIAIGAVGYFTGGDIKTYVALGVMSSIASWMLTPFTFLRSALLGESVISLFIVAFFNILLILAVLGFVMDRRL